MVDGYRVNRGLCGFGGCREVCLKKQGDDGEVMESSGAYVDD